MNNVKNIKSITNKHNKNNKNISRTFFSIKLFSAKFFLMFSAFFMLLWSFCTLALDSLCKNRMYKNSKRNSSDTIVFFNKLVYIKSEIISCYFLNKERRTFIFSAFFFTIYFIVNFFLKKQLNVTKITFILAKYFSISSNFLSKEKCNHILNQKKLLQQ